MSNWTNCILLIMLTIGMIYAIRYVLRDNKVLESQLYDMMISKESKKKSRISLSHFSGDLAYILTALLMITFPT